jgi:hypothetical protein
LHFDKIKDSGETRANQTQAFSGIPNKDFMDLLQEKQQHTHRCRTQNTTGRQIKNRLQLHMYAPQELPKSQLLNFFFFFYFVLWRLPNHPTANQDPYKIWVVSLFEVYVMTKT